MTERPPRDESRLEALVRYHESMRHLAEQRQRRAESEMQSLSQRLGDTIREQESQIRQLERRVVELELELVALKTIGPRDP